MQKKEKNGNEVVNVEEDIWDYLESQRLKIPQKVSFHAFLMVTQLGLITIYIDLIIL